MTDRPASSGPLPGWLTAACLWEATARKPGNVHRYRDFEDVGYLDFALSAALAGPVLAGAAAVGVGQTILDAVTATRAAVSTNTNLGMILLLAPLAAAPAGRSLRRGVETVLSGLSQDDSRRAFEAIRLASPGGLGDAEEEDVRNEPTRPLREVMSLAADRDLIARQYRDGYADVFKTGLPAVARGLGQSGRLETAVVRCHLEWLAAFPDSLIVRKCGAATAAEASRRAGGVLAAGWPKTPAGQAALDDLDAWLREDGHRRNPGTSADLVCASLFAALREGVLTLPPRFPW